MGRIVREHYPVDKLPEDLRHGLAVGDDVRVIVEASEQSVPVPSGGHFSRFRHLTRANFSSPEDVEAHVIGLREDWDR